MCKFTVACDHAKRTDFVPVEAWNQAHLPAYLSKGSKVLVSGYLKQNTWQTKTGEKRQRIIINANSVEFLDPKPDGADSETRQRQVPQAAAVG